MHLLYIGDNGAFSLAEFYGKQIPSYAILSHTWIASHEEVTFKDITKGRGQRKAGYGKLNFIAKQATADNLRYFWVDTCCIDKASSAELQEAINSMFLWYQKSSKCYVYLADVTSGTPSNIAHDRMVSSHQSWKPAFLQSRWFTRGWTLQELLAPRTVQFFSSEGNLLGDKISLWSDIEKVTEIPLDVLQGDYAYLLRYPLEKRLSWAAERETTREEDAAYSLLGLFNLHIPLLYGEGRRKAFSRLHRERESVMVYEKTHVAAATHVQAELPETGGPFDTADKQEITKQTPLKRSANHAFADPIDEERQSITLRSPHTAPGLDTSTIASSKRSRSRTPLAEKVIQADIRIDSIEDSGPDPAATQLILTKNTSPDAEDVNDKKRMKMWWNASSAQSLNLPEYYAQVAVLLIKWSNELDELYTRNEVQEASELFRDRYGYRAEIVELDVRSKPQHQLNRRILSFIAENDGPNNLLIVYYVGCGVFRDLEHYLELRAFVNPARARGFEKDARANWNRVEDILRSEDVESDVLTILDVGFTSNIGQDLPALPYTASSSAISESRCFELITSIQIDQSGAPIGEGIFTRSLIDTLRSCLDEKPGQPISTFRLAQQINLDKRRVEAPVQIWSRGLQSKHILLQPLKPGLLQRYEMFRGRTGGRLTLELELRDEQLNEAQIEYLANNIGKALRDKAILGLRKINWLGMEPVQQSHADRVALVMFAFVKWKEVVRQRRERRRAEELSVSE